MTNLRLSSNTTFKTMFTAFIGHSWSNHYGAPLRTLGGPRTQGIITRVAQNNCVELQGRPRLSTIAGILTLQRNLRNTDLGAIEPWASLARRNSPATRAFGVPLLIAQNPKDELVAVTVTATHARRLCRSGARVRYVTINGAGHATSAKDSAATTLAWIADRFAGRRAPSDCARL